MEIFFKKIIFVLLIALVLIGCGDDKKEIFYVALGASDAVGIGATPLTNGYVYKIQDGLEDKDNDVYLLNLGWPGADIGKIKDIVEDLVIDIIADKVGDPDLITLWTGSNDVVAGDDPDDFRFDLEDILSQLSKNTSAFIVIANIPKLYDLPRFKDEPDKDVTTERIDDFNKAIKDAIEQDPDIKVKVSIVDLFAEEISEDLVFDLDGFHPNNEGYQRIAELFLEIILPEFAKVKNNQGYMLAFK